MREHFDNFKQESAAGGLAAIEGMEQQHLGIKKARERAYKDSLASREFNVRQPKKPAKKRVKQILAHVETDPGAAMRYLVRWEGGAEKDRSWVDAGDLQAISSSTRSLLQAYNQEHVCLPTASARPLGRNRPVKRQNQSEHTEDPPHRAHRPIRIRDHGAGHGAGRRGAGRKHRHLLPQGSGEAKSTRGAGHNQHRRVHQRRKEQQMKRQMRGLDAHMLRHPKDYYKFDDSGHLRASNEIFAKQMEELRSDLEARIDNTTEAD
jgi:hypothetical protein